MGLGKSDMMRLILLMILLAGLTMAQDSGVCGSGNSVAVGAVKVEVGPDTITASRVAEEIRLDARHPAVEWQRAQAIAFCADWQGKNADSGRETRVRALWTPKTLYLRFECRYREIFIFENSNANGRRDHLWDRDVAETFLQPDPSRPPYYREFEVSPNGMWIDLDIFPDGLNHLKSGLTRSVWVDEKNRMWAAEIAIPMKALTEKFDPAAVWRTNFFRVEGQREPRFYSAWRPTNTPEPNFHVPAVFGKLKFAER